MKIENCSAVKKGNKSKLGGLALLTFIGLLLALPLLQRGLLSADPTALQSSAMSRPGDSPSRLNGENPLAGAEQSQVVLNVENMT